ncbi:MFS transporter [Bacillus solimangrovi]|uniref:MFS transporter n=1 Tax=Bacillus solimangrovi TaxID=1305675 RepID=A0A1E5LB80_9BACI|nr:MFS transporter [Bacillus solimangrovi]OEH91332.1 MFS transporter [Bacillus solimangrovi]
MNGKLQRRFWLLVSAVALSGFSQGMLLPLIAIIFEQSGISSTVNGMHAAGLYIGLLIASPFMEKPLQKFGFKPMILTGGILVITSLALFPIWKALWFWFVLRLVIGIGDHMLHFGTQTWITSFSPVHKRGRNIAIYGLFFSLGFSIGPLMTRLVTINEALPFLLSAGLSFIIWALLLTLRNELPENNDTQPSFFQSFKRFHQAWKIAWFAFLLPFGYGFLESTLHGNFPVYALRIGITVEQLSILLPAFAVGTIILQIPLGTLSDKYGRRKIITIILFGGVLTFICASLLEDSFIGLFICFITAGMLVGSTFSLGLSYMTDLLPKHLLPAGNILCGICFSLGSIVGPLIGGIVIQLFDQGSFFYIISSMLFIIWICVFFAKERSSTLNCQSNAS